MNPEIKICGITKEREAAYLNEANVNFAGFVFYEKSKRNITLSTAQSIMAKLNATIKKVAVCVSPTREQFLELEAAGFDVIQIHKMLSDEILKIAKCPLWLAVNVSDVKELEVKLAWYHRLPEVYRNKIIGVVVDGANYGSGQTFDWSKVPEDLMKELKELSFVLAGGLNKDNVEKGIMFFAPDIVDVSTGVEGEDGKDREKILEFVRKVRG